MKGFPTVSMLGALRPLEGWETLNSNNLQRTYNMSLFVDVSLDQKKVRFYCLKIINISYDNFLNVVYGHRSDCVNL